MTNVKFLISFRLLNVMQKSDVTRIFWGTQFLPCISLNTIKKIKTKVTEHSEISILCNVNFSNFWAVIFIKMMCSIWVSYGFLLNWQQKSLNSPDNSYCRNPTTNSIEIHWAVSGTKHLTNSQQHGTITFLHEILQLNMKEICNLLDPWQ